MREIGNYFEPHYSRISKITRADDSIRLMKKGKT